MKILRRGRLERPVLQIRANRERISRRGRSNEPIQIDKTRGIPTVFEDLGSDCRVETVESPTDCTRTKLAVYDRGSLWLVDQFEANGHLLIPKERGHGIFKCLRLPKGATIYESVHSLFHRTQELLCTAVDLDPAMATLVSVFVMSIVPGETPGRAVSCVDRYAGFGKDDDTSGFGEAVSA